MLANPSYLKLDAKGHRQIPQRISVAPMMDYTDRHCRYLLRLVSPYAWLYTEMVTANALVHGNALHLLEYNDEEHPVVLQLGGSDPLLLAQAVKIAEQFNYDEINLNVGCPSDRVQQGKFGACLMLEPNLVAQCVEAMADQTDKPITVKHRIGVDKNTGYDFVANFVSALEKTSCSHLIVHARSAWLKGLSPKQNREVPPLDYDVVYKLKRDFPQFFVEINGGITDVDSTLEHLKYTDGVMIGRAAVNDLYLLNQIDNKLYDSPLGDRHQIVLTYMDYIENQRSGGASLAVLTKPLLGLFAGQSGGRAFRRTISESVVKKPESLGFILEALKHTQRV